MTRFAGDGNPVPRFGDYAEITVAGIRDLPEQWRGGYWQSLLAGYGNFSMCEVIGEPRALLYAPVGRVCMFVSQS